MLVYGTFIRIGGLIQSGVSCVLSLFIPFHAQVDKSDALFLWDFMYLRSRFLQAHFNYRLNYRAYELHHTSELHSLVAKCGIWHEEHVNIDQCATSGGRVDLYRLNRDRNTTRSENKAKKTFVLVHGILQSVDVFIAGGHSSIAAHLLRGGHDVWLLSKSASDTGSTPDSVPATPAVSGLHSPGLVEAKVSTTVAVESTHLTCTNLIAVAKYIANYNNRNNNHDNFENRDWFGTPEDTSVCWVGHSTGCEEVLTALAYCSTVRAASTAELRRRTSGAVLLSPVLTLTHLNRHAGGATTNNVSSGSDSLEHTILLHEVLLHSPDTTYTLLGRDTLLLSLQQWRDILTAHTYCNTVVAPLCRRVLGWSFVNIALHRRTELLQHLLYPTSTTPLVTLLYASQGTHEHSDDSRVYALLVEVYTLYRWCWRYAWLTADVSLRLVGWTLGVEVSVFGLGKRAGSVCDATGSTVSSSEKVTHTNHLTKHATSTTNTNYINTSNTTNTTSTTTTNKTHKRSSSYTAKPRILSITGTHDNLCNTTELEARLAVLAEQYSFDKDVRQISGYEHMDTLWADTAPELVFNVI